MKTIYTAEYTLVDSINRIRKRGHMGVYTTLAKIERDKKKAIKAHPDHRVLFEIHPVHQLFQG